MELLVALNCERGRVGRCALKAKLLQAYYIDL